MILLMQKLYIAIRSEIELTKIVNQQIDSKRKEAAILKKDIKKI